MVSSVYTRVHTFLQGERLACEGNKYSPVIAISNMFVLAENILGVLVF
jgi:hypothetical protein